MSKQATKPVDLEAIVTFLNVSSKYAMFVFAIICFVDTAKALTRLSNQL